MTGFSGGRVRARVGTGVQQRASAGGCASGRGCKERGVGERRRRAELVFSRKHLRLPRVRLRPALKATSGRPPCPCMSGAGERAGHAKLTWTLARQMPPPLPSLRGRAARMLFYCPHLLFLHGRLLHHCLALPPCIHITLKLPPPPPSLILLCSDRPPRLGTRLLRTPRMIRDSCVRAPVL